MDRFSFLVADAQQQVLAIKSYAYRKPINAAYSLALGIKDLCRSDELLTAPYRSVRIALLNDKNTLIPEALYEKDAQRTYLEHVLEYAPQDRLRVDSIPGLALRNVYAVDPEVFRALEGFFPQAQLFHAHSPTIQGFHKLAALQSEHRVYINVHGGQVQVLAFRGKDLLLSNAFPFESSTDFIYYVLLVYQQFELKPEIVPLTIAGWVVEDSEIYHLLYRYIRLLHFVQAPDYYRFPEALHQEGQLVHFFDLCSLKLCE